MEVKINREIRNYTESMFFGLSMRQFIFSILAVAVAVGLYFLLKPYVGTEIRVVDVYYRRCSLCGAGVHHLPRHDCRAIYLGMDSLGTFRAERDSF